MGGGDAPYMDDDGNWRYWGGQLVNNSPNKRSNKKEDVDIREIVKEELIKLLKKKKVKNIK